MNGIAREYPVGPNGNGPLLQRLYIHLLALPRADEVDESFAGDVWDQAVYFTDRVHDGEGMGIAADVFGWLLMLTCGNDLEFSGPAGAAVNHAALPELVRALCQPAPDGTVPTQVAGGYLLGLHDAQTVEAIAGGHDYDRIIDVLRELIRLAPGGARIEAAERATAWEQAKSAVRVLGGMALSPVWGERATQEDVGLVFITALIVGSGEDEPCHTEARRLAPQWFGEAFGCLLLLAQDLGVDRETVLKSADYFIESLGR